MYWQEKHSDCVCPSPNTLFPGLSQENTGRAIESASECVSECQAWHDFVSEYWTSLLCDLRVKRIVQWHPALSRRGRVYINQFLCRATHKGLLFQRLFSFFLFLGLFFWSVAPHWEDAALRARRQETKHRHSTLRYGPKPPQSVNYGSPPSPQLLEGLSGNRCISGPHLARHRELIHAGEERPHGGDGDTCHRSSAGWSVTDKYSPWDMNLLQILPAEQGQTKWERQQGEIRKGHSMQKKVKRGFEDVSCFTQSFKVGFVFLARCGWKEARLGASQIKCFSPFRQTWKESGTRTWITLTKERQRSNFRTDITKYVASQFFSHYEPQGTAEDICNAAALHNHQTQSSFSLARCFHLKGI